MDWSGSSWLGREWAGKCGSFGSCSQRRIQMSANMCSDGMAESPMFCEWVFSVDLTATRNSYISCIHSLGETPRSVVPTISTPCVPDPGTVVGMRSERVDLNMPPFALPLSNHETLGRPQTAKHPPFLHEVIVKMRRSTAEAARILRGRRVSVSPMRCVSSSHSCTISSLPEP